ncbi:hypothetical protein ZWY2020_032685 [Hordeum vulgare]|nr:hypothetical protein ZWY2020_032685 [Hordeum vulgare]
MPPLKPAMLQHVDPTRRPRESRSVAVPSPAVDQAIFFLRSHAVTLTAADGVNASSPMAVGRALEAQLAVPEHSLRVTAHHPEHYLVLFTQPAHQVNAVRRASIRVDGAVFNVASWHEHDHASFGSLLLHVWVVIEGVLMHYWSVEGAEEILGRLVRVDRLDSRTLERGHTKTFACWVWTDGVGNIPTKHSLGVLPRGAGRVEEMGGFSPPDRRVAPPPAMAEYSMIIHVDQTGLSATASRLPPPRLLRHRLPPRPLPAAPSASAFSDHSHAGSPRLYGIAGTSRPIGLERRGKRRPALVMKAACSASSATPCTATATAAFVVVSPHFRVSTRHPSSLSRQSRAAPLLSPLSCAKTPAPPEPRPAALWSRPPTIGQSDGALPAIAGRSSEKAPAGKALSGA